MNTLRFKKKVLSVFGTNSEHGKGAFVLSYLHNRWRFPNLKHPKDLSEIWIKRILDGEINKIYYLADKYLVRSYVEERGLANILTPLLQITPPPNSPEIDFASLPQKFALKANFGAGMNIICLDKSTLDIEACKQKMQQWMQPRLYSHSERHYNLIEKRIVCEEFIDDGTGGFPVDYKFMCIHGKVACILACSGREQGHADYLPYSTEWEPLYDYYRSFPKDIQLLSKPANLREMIATAEKLAEGIDLVRVDLYSNGSRIWFGEMTLTPAGAIFHRWTQKAMDELGSKALLKE